jgi:hypothetical protein
MDLTLTPARTAQAGRCQHVPRPARAAAARPAAANRPSGPSPARRLRATLAGSDRTRARAPLIGQKRASPGSARSSQDGSRDTSDGSAGCSCCSVRGQGVRRTRRADGCGVPARGGPALLGLQRPRQRARAAAAPGGEALGGRRERAALHGLPWRPAHAPPRPSAQARALVSGPNGSDGRRSCARGQCWHRNGRAWRAVAAAHAPQGRLNPRGGDQLRSCRGGTGSQDRCWASGQGRSPWSSSPAPGQPAVVL